MRAADGVLIVSAEYNWSIPGGLKNAIDWLSRYKEVSFKDKPVLHPVGGAGPAGRLAHAVPPAHGACRRSTRSCSASPR